MLANQAIFKENDSEIEQLLIRGSLTDNEASRLHVNKEIQLFTKNGKEYYILKSTNPNYDINIELKKQLTLRELSMTFM